MAEFVRKDGAPITLPKRYELPQGEPFRLVGYVTDFDTFTDHLTMRRSVRLNLEIPEEMINAAGGLVPHIVGGGWVEIRQVTDPKTWAVAADPLF
jgi:hypothetical protein